MTIAFTAMRFYNLSLAFVMTGMALLMWSGAEGKRDFETVLYATVGPLWLVGSVVLFFRSTVAWCASLLGAGTLASSSITFIAWGAVMSPAAQDPTDGVAFAFFYGAGGVLLSAPLLYWLVQHRPVPSSSCNLG